MAKVRLDVRTMDVFNGGVYWEGPLSVEIEEQAEGETVEQVAWRVNVASWIACGEGEQGEEEPGGEVVRAAGSDREGITWIEDLGHQGGTHLLLEWHEAK